MKEPPAGIWGALAWRKLKAPLRLTPITRSHSRGLDLEDRRHPGGAGRVDDRAERAVLLGDPRDRGGDGVAVADVDGDRAGVVGRRA